MKTSVIPAQITTVEDKIAGDLNLTQIVLLLLALIVATLIFALFPKQMYLNYYKIPLMVISGSFFLIMALRIKGKVLIEWLLVLVRFNTRPKFYLFNKNSTYLRDGFLTKEPKTEASLAKKTKVTVTREKIADINISELMAFEKLIKNPKFQLSFKSGKKGGLNVAVSEIQS